MGILEFLIAVSLWCQSADWSVKIKCQKTVSLCYLHKDNETMIKCMSKGLPNEP